MLVRKSVLPGSPVPCRLQPTTLADCRAGCQGAGPVSFKGTQVAAMLQLAAIGLPGWAAQELQGADGPGMPGFAGPYGPGGPGHLWLLAGFKLVARHIILLREQDTSLAYEVRHELAHVFDNVTVTMELERAVLCYLSDTVFLYITGYDA